MNELKLNITKNLPEHIKTFYKNKRCLITGAGGFIGSHLAEVLHDVGATVRVLLHYNSRSAIGNLIYIPPETQAALDIVYGDVTDPYATAQAMKECDIVFHLAALIAIPYSYRAPQQYVTTNILGTLNILEAARVHQVQKIIHTSTSETYGTAQYIPIDEKHPLQGQSPYAATKIGADKIVESYFLSFGIPVATVRPFNTYGPRQSARAIIPTLITQLLTQEKIHVGNLHSQRDFNFVANTVTGFLTVGAHPKTEGEVFNVGSGVMVSIQEVLTLLEKITGKKKPVVVVEERLRPEKSEVMQLQCNSTKIQTLLGWQPAVDLQHGLEYTVDWISHHLDAFTATTYTI